MDYFKSRQLYWLIALIVLVNAVGMLFPVLRNDDPPLYASIAKNMLLNHDWLSLTHAGLDWLDKPHFPFWVTAVSYSIFGINSVAYILPGFIFHLIGAYYTYRLGRELYSHDVGLIAVVIYLSSLHLMLSAVDVRAEVYLLGSIMPACYYWYKYNQLARLRSLFLGAAFTALALMSKGLFTLVTISGGLFGLWIYTHRLVNLIRLKWIIALILSFVFIAPELIALYIQFDMNPMKVIFNHTHVSGIKWFFWDSQFGRFLNNGPIVHSGNNSFGHYFFFIHTFLWSFLPWSFILLVALVNVFRKFGKLNLRSKENIVYLLSSFLPTFILFSISTFQLDYYINILIPFAAIFCANWIVEYRINSPRIMHKVFYVQIWFAIILILAVIGASILIFGKPALATIGLTGLLVFILFIAFIHQDDLTKAILYPVLAISLVFVFLMFIYGRIYIKYDVGYETAMYLNKKPYLPVIDYNVNSLTLEFHSHSLYKRVDGDGVDELRGLKKPYYMLIKTDNLPMLQKNLAPSNIKVIRPIDGATIDVVMANLLSRPRLANLLTHYLIVQVN